MATVAFVLLTLAAESLALVRATVAIHPGALDVAKLEGTFEPQAKSGEVTSAHRLQEPAAPPLRQSW